MTNQFAFSKKGDELLEQSIKLEEVRKPGEMYLDPVWGLVQVPYDDLELGEVPTCS